MNSLAIKTTGELSDKEVAIAEIREAQSNIKASLKIQAERGNKEAAWILKHL